MTYGQPLTAAGSESAVGKAVRRNPLGITCRPLKSGPLISFGTANGEAES